MEANLESKIVSVEDLAVSTDPVVYQLVRVDGDGRLVPATDDEIMVVEDFLEDDKIEHIESDPGQSLKHGTLERYNAGSNYQPDLSNLTVKELKDIFKATFEKETTVKDKQLLGFKS